MSDPIDRAALLLLEELATRIRDGAVMVTSLGCVDDATMSLALNWKERPTTTETAPPASAPHTIEPQGCCPKPRHTVLPDGSAVCLSCGAETES